MATTETPSMRNRRTCHKSTPAMVGLAGSHRHRFSIVTIVSAHVPLDVGPPMSEGTPLVPERVRPLFVVLRTVYRPASVRGSHWFAGATPTRRTGAGPVGIGMTALPLLLVSSAPLHRYVFAPNRTVPPPAATHAAIAAFIAAVSSVVPLPTAPCSSGVVTKATVATRSASSTAVR